VERSINVVEVDLLIHRAGGHAVPVKHRGVRDVHQRYLEGRAHPFGCDHDSGLVLPVSPTAIYVDSTTYLPHHSPL